MKKQKRIFTALALAVVAAFAQLYAIQTSHAAGGVGEWSQSQSLSATTSTTDSHVTLTVRIYNYRCDEYNYEYRSSPERCSGGPGSLPVPELDGTMNKDVRLAVVGGTATPELTKTNADGYATFQLSSTIPGTLTYTIYSVLVGGTSEAANGSGTVTFTTPPPAPAPAPKPRATTAPVAPVVEVAPPATPTPTFTVAGKEVKVDEKPTITDKEKMTLSGKTVPNGVVTIYVFSEPKKYTTTADAEGNWTYDVSGLPAGDHHIETEVTDPATGKTSERKSVLAFSVIKAPTPAPAASTTSTPEAKKSPVVAILIGAVAAATLGGGGYFAWKRWGQKRVQG